MNQPQNKKRSIGTLEWVVIYILVMIVPVHVLLMNYWSNGQSWQTINQLWLVSVTLSIVMLVLLLATLLVKKPYLAMVYSCHQISERSFKCKHHQWPICARCSGIFVGQFLMLVFSRNPFNHWWLLVGMIPLLIDGFTQQWTHYRSTNPRRFITGLLFGPALIVMMKAMYVFITQIIINGLEYFL